MIATSCNLCAKAATCATPARSSWEEPIKRVIGVLERILGHEGNSGYDPEGMIPPS